MAPQDVDITLVSLALLFFPGVIWAAVHRTFCAKERSSNFDFVLNTFVFGVVAYVVTIGVYLAFGHEHPIHRILEKPENLASGLISLIHLGIATFIALGLSIVWTYATNKKWFANFLLKIKVTKRLGNEDVWDMMFNNDQGFSDFVQLRDYEKERVYSGWVDSFSENGKLRELFLSDCQVHDFDGRLFYDMPYMYIARSQEDLHIDFPMVTSNKELADGDDKTA